LSRIINNLKPFWVGFLWKGRWCKWKRISKLAERHNCLGEKYKLYIQCWESKLEDYVIIYSVCEQNRAWAGLEWSATFLLLRKDSCLPGRKFFIQVMFTVGKLENIEKQSCPSWSQQTEIINTLLNSLHRLFSMYVYIYNKNGARWFSWAFFTTQCWCLSFHKWMTLPLLDFTF
jgi:hypothetical protein